MDIFRNYTFLSKAWFSNVFCNSSQGTYKQVPNKPMNESCLHFVVTIVHLFLYSDGNLGCTFYIFFNGADYAPAFLTVKGGGIQSKTDLISSSSLNKIVHQTSVFLNESQIYNKHKNLPIHSQSATSVP